MNHDEKKKKNHDGSEPLGDPGYETVAQFFGTPGELRQFKSVTALAEHLGISRTTIYRRAANVCVAKRIRWLIERNTIFGDLAIRCEWGGITQAQIKAALEGDTRAAAWCEKRAWPKSELFDPMNPEPALAAWIQGALQAEGTPDSEEEEGEEEEEKEKENDGEASEE